MRRIRLRQQEELDRQARAAKKQQPPPEEEAATKKPKKKKTTVRSAPPDSGYSPMQPWTASQGGGYKYVFVVCCNNLRGFFYHV